MSLPPDTIQVKRKVDSDDGPVNFLRVEEPKRRRSGAWLYQRKRADQDGPPGIPPQLRETIRPVIHTSRPRDDTAPRNAAAANASSQSSRNGSSPNPPVPAGEAVMPRRFHMTRPQPILPSGHAPNSRILKKARYAPTVFVERGGKRKKAGAAATGEFDSQDAISASFQDVSLAESMPARAADQGMKEAIPVRLKRPGLARKARAKKQDADGIGGARPPLPPSLLNRQHDDNMEQLTRDMDAYALEQIGFNLNRMDEDRKSSQPTVKPVSTTPKKYRPRAPSQRYAERHSVAASPAEPVDVEMHDSDMQDSDTGDENYVIETYVRVPVSTMTDAVPAKEVGLLVFDNDPDVEFFYGAEGDSEDEELDDDDADSNAEDYYTADYPDDEVESDDEYGRDPYHYRTGNASDLEEFDGDGVNGSDEESPTKAGGFGSLRSGVFGIDRSHG